MASIDYHVNKGITIDDLIVRHGFPGITSDVWQAITDRASVPLTWSQSLEDPFVPGFSISEGPREKLFALDEVDKPFGPMLGCEKI